MKDINVLITSVGRRAPLVKAFKEAQKTMPGFYNSKTVCANIDSFCAGLYVGDAHYIVPSVESENYLGKIVDICRKEHIKIIIPTIDLELMMFARERHDLSEVGINVVISDPEAIRIGNDKLATFIFFCGNYIPTPTTYYKKDISYLKFPLIIKPRLGRGSKGIYKLDGLEEYEFYQKRVNDYILQDFLEGTEFTVDLLADFNGQIISVVPRTRQVVRAGVSDQGKTFKDKTIMDYAIKIAEKLGAIGPINIQGFITKDGPKFTEINPRFSGAIPLTIASGANFPALLLRMAAGEEVKPIIGQFKENLTMLRYEESIFRECL